MSEENKCHAGCDEQTEDVKRNLYPRIANSCDLRKFPWKKVCGDDRHLASVGDGDTEGDHKVADYKVKNPQRQCCWQQGDPHLMDVNHNSKEKSNHKTE